MRILIIEDEKDLNKMVSRNLKEAGYEVDSCFDGEEAQELLEVENYDLVVLDLNLPEIDGMEILENFRKYNQETKVIILSARSQIKDKVEGLDNGANDYMSKPFHLDELEARIRSLTRRNFITNSQDLIYKNLVFDSKKRIARVGEEVINLTRKETGILEYLLLNRGRPISQEELIDHVWDTSVDPFSNSIRVHMSALRKKLKKYLSYDPIKNRVGLGYELEDD